jgi:hypothetical protein
MEPEAQHCGHPNFPRHLRPTCLFLGGSNAIAPAHPLKAIGVVATIIVLVSAMLVKEAWRSCEFWSPAKGGQFNAPSTYRMCNLFLLDFNV